MKHQEIVRAKVHLQKENPFFSYLIMNLNIIKDDENCESCAVDSKGNLYYNSKWIKKLSDEELKGVLSHEVCLTPNSLILTKEGLKEISKIKVGEEVYSKGYFTKVKAISKRKYKGKMYNLKSRYGLNDLNFTPNHPIQAIKNNHKKNLGFCKSIDINKQQRFYNCEDLKINDGLTFEFPTFERIKTRNLFRTRKHYTPHFVKLNKDMAYFLGHFVGDGYVGKQKGSYEWFGKEDKKDKKYKTITITTHTKNKKYLKRLLKIVDKDIYRTAKIYDVKNKNAIRLIFGGVGLAKYLRDNFYDNKGNKKIPYWLLFEKKEIIKSFIQGLEDSDGNTTNGMTSITSVSNQVYSFLPLLLLKIGYISSIRKNKKYNPKHQTSYCICWKKEKIRNSAIFKGNKVIIPLKEKKEFNYDGYVYNLETETHMYSSLYMTIHNCHLVLEHLQRGENKEQEIYNIASDLVINAILVNNSFKLPEGLVPYNNSFEFKLPEGLVPYNNSFEFKDEKENVLFTIKDLDKKSADEVYNELMKHRKKKKENQGIIMVGKSRFDKHIYGKKGKGNDGKDEQKEQQENKKKWKKVFSEASVYAKNQGKLPDGMDRLIDIVLNEKVSWKNLLYKYITNELPFDYHYGKPSRRSRATGIYMPSIKRENIEIVIAVDTSGSIEQKELSEFLSEIVGISKSFSNIKMRVLFCDSEVQDDFEVSNGNIVKILQERVKGGGGTSFKNPLNYIVDKGDNVKFVIFFTDGYGDKINYGDYPFKLIWVLTKNSTDNYVKDSGDIINLE